MRLETARGSFTSQGAGRMESNGMDSPWSVCARNSIHMQIINIITKNMTLPTAQMTTGWWTTFLDGSTPDEAKAREVRAADVHMGALTEFLSHPLPDEYFAPQRPALLLIPEKPTEHGYQDLVRQAHTLSTTMDKKRLLLLYSLNDFNRQRKAQREHAFIMRTFRRKVDVCETVSFNEKRKRIDDQKKKLKEREALNVDFEAEDYAPPFARSIPSGPTLGASGSRTNDTAMDDSKESKEDMQQQAARQSAQAVASTPHVVSSSQLSRTSATAPPSASPASSLARRSEPGQKLYRWSDIRGAPASSSPSVSPASSPSPSSDSVQQGSTTLDIQEGHHVVFHGSTPSVTAECEGLSPSSGLQLLSMTDKCAEMEQ